MQSTKNTNYDELIEMLRYMTEEQLVELMIDIDDKDALTRIIIAAHQIKFKDWQEDDDDISDEQDYKDVDDARRARELK